MIAVFDAVLTRYPLCDGATQAEIERAEIAEEGEGEQEDAVADFSNLVQVEGDRSEADDGRYQQAKKVDEC